jgi:hypothetical protein
MFLRHHHHHHCRRRYVDGNTFTPAHRQELSAKYAGAARIDLQKVDFSVKVCIALRAWHEYL